MTQNDKPESQRAPAKIYLSEVELEAMTGISKSTWRRRRADGDGPEYIKTNNRILYKTVDVVAWLDSKKVSSTSEYTSHQKGRPRAC